MPRNDDWTIHGIWPSKSLQRGPESCRPDLPFQVNELRTIRSQLVRRWINVLNNNPEGFWKHEWEKHGTCSVDLADLNTQLKYFSKAIEWNTRFRINNYLSRGRITPGRSYPIGNIMRAINAGLRVTPQVTCIKDSVSIFHFFLLFYLFNKFINYKNN